MKTKNVLSGSVLILTFILNSMTSVCFASVEPELTMAVSARNLGHVRTLLAQGTKVDERDESEEQTPLMRAAQIGDAAIATLLLTHGADVNAKDDEGATALLIAVQRGDTSFVRLLLQWGADPGYRDSDGVSVLNLAQRKGNKALVKVLTQAINRNRTVAEKKTHTKIVAYR